MFHLKALRAHTGANEGRHPRRLCRPSPPAAPWKGMMIAVGIYLNVLPLVVSDTCLYNI